MVLPSDLPRRDSLPHAFYRPTRGDERGKGGKSNPSRANCQIPIQYSPYAPDIWCADGGNRPPYPSYPPHAVTGAVTCSTHHSEPPFSFDTLIKRLPSITLALNLRR